MAQTTLAVKYRPKSFDAVVEQDAIKIILGEQIRTETFKHAYLFSGPAGCGKTTAARIFASDLNRGRGNPIEVDAASNNGVDNVRNIIDDSKRKPIDSEYKVYIIDEVHMLSTGAWNALLKLLEEPPVCTVFVMCTTDPQKIPATILSRVQRYDFSKISLSQIADRLKMIIGNENQELEEFWGGHAKENGEELYSFEDDAVEYIAKLADGGMRDAITMLDKCMSLSREISVLNVVKALGTVNYATHFELLYAATTKQTSIGVTVLESVYNSGKDIKQFIKQFQYFALDVCKFKLFGDFSFTNMPNLPEYEQKMGDEDYEECLKVLDWARQVNADIKWEANPKAFLETSFILFTRR